MMTPHTTPRLGFWSVLALVMGSQIGSGVFMSPAHLAPSGLMGLWGWAIAGCGAMSLAFVFAQLCTSFPQTGGPHVYIHKIFGRDAAFFTGWTYWVASWVSTTTVITTIAGYLTPLTGILSIQHLVVLELTILFVFLGLNLKGVIFAGRAEFFLTLLKLIPLLLLPLGALFFLRWEHFAPSPPTTEAGLFPFLGSVTLITLWGFIGLEAATTPAGSVYQPQITIPKAVMWGTFTVACIYALNSFCIMGALPSDALARSHAPYADVAGLFGGTYASGFISIIGAIICMGTLNAWILVSGQVVLGLAESGLFPSCFLRRTSSGAPVWGLLLSTVGLIPLLILTARPNLAEQMLMIVNISVTALLFVYALCSLAYLVLWKRTTPKAWFSATIGLVALGFCAGVISCLPLATLGIASLFIVTGLPLFLWQRCRNRPTLPL